MGILTDRENNPFIAAKFFIRIRQPSHSEQSHACMYVCERLGYPDEKITKGTPG